MSDATRRRRFPRGVIYALAAGTLACSPREEPANAMSPFSVVTDSAVIRLGVGARAVALPLDSLIGPWRVDTAGRLLSGAWKFGEARMLHAALVHDTVFILLDVSGQSRPGGSTMCGAGTEGDFVWLRVPRVDPIPEPKVVRYESCWESQDGQQYERNADSLWGRWQSYHRHREIGIAYMFGRPELGLRVTERPLPR